MRGGAARGHHASGPAGLPAQAEEALNHSLTFEDVEAIERATLDALPPLTLIEDDGWLLAANGGVVARANSVLPLRTGADDPEARIERAIAFYAREGLPPAFRVSPWSAPSDLAARLEARGFHPSMRTLVMTADAPAVAARLGNAGEAVLAPPGPEWAALFLGPGVDPGSGAARLATLMRGRAALFAQAVAQDRLAAIGALGLGDGWAGLHGMRTAQAFRRQGLASAVLKTLVEAARGRGIERLFLQVEADNEGAIALYRRLGFETAYDYSYWRSG